MGTFWRRPAQLPFTGLLMLCALAQGTIQAQQVQLVINEVMASNSGTLEDLEGDAHDWIELFNPSGTAVALHGYFLSDDISMPAKHQLNDPLNALIVPAQGHLVLWASGEPAKGAAHLSFKLSAGGEPVVLTSPGGILLDLVQLGEQYTDISFGREGDGSVSWAYLDPPTPGSANELTGYAGRTDPPVFSVPAGFHSGSLSLALTHSDPAAVIYYSVDGSVPRADLLPGKPYAYKNTFPVQNDPSVGPLIFDTMRAQVYSAPLTLNDIFFQENWISKRTTTAHASYPMNYMPWALQRKAHIIRAQACKPGYLPSETVSSSYFLTPDGTSPYSLPLISLMTEKDHLFGFHNGIYNPGIDYEEWRLAQPSAFATGHTPANWKRKTEYPLSLEWFDEDATARAFQRNGGFRPHGSYSKMYRRKTLRLYFRDRYGADGLGHQLFPGQSDTGFKRLLVHISGNDDPSTNIRDMSMQAMVRHMRFETMDARPCVVFLDGEFWGIHAMRERYDAPYFKRRHGLEKEEIDFVERYRVASIGDSIAWVNLLDQVAVQDPADPAVYADLLTRIDVDNHIDFHVAEIFVGNTDWPQNNWKAWRKRTDGLVGDAPYGHDGRWRWVIYDLDWGFNLNNTNPSSFAFLARAVAPAAGEHTLLFRRMLNNTGYRQAFITRAADMLNTAFRPHVVNGILDHYRDMIAPDMPEHIARWPDSPWTMGQWQERLDVAYAFGSDRQQYFRQELQDHFQLPAQHELVADVSDTEAGWVELNTLELRPGTYAVDAPVYPWNGIYFEGVPVKLVAHAHPGWQFSHWTGLSAGTDSLLTLDLTSSGNIVAVFTPAPYCAQEPVHYWHFNGLPSGSLAMVPADLSTSDEARISYTGTGSGYMDHTPANDGTALNALPDMSAGKGLRVRNPGQGRSLLIEAPSTRYRDISLSFATHRTSNGPDTQRVSYTIDPERLEWHVLDAFATPETFAVKQFTLDGIDGTFDNAHLAFRIEFLGPTSTGYTGNSRFDNILVNGRPVDVYNALACGPDDSFTYEGNTYFPGLHLLVNDTVMDCSRHLLLRVGIEEHNLTVELQDGQLVVVQPSSGHQWMNCADMMPIPFANGSALSPEDEGFYAVSADMDGCAVISECYYAPGDIHTGIWLYPMPMQEQLNVTFKGDRTGGDFMLTDATGRLVLQGDLRKSGNTISTKELVPGTYVLHVYSAHGGSERWVRVVMK